MPASEPLWPYHTLGSRQQPTLLFLHGFMGRGLDWQPVAEPLADQFFCVMPDLPGHGQNLALPWDQPLSFPAVISGLMTLLSHLELTETQLVGYSMGGRLALYAAVTFPKKIKALVLEGAHPGLAEPQARLERAQADDRYASLLMEQGVEHFVARWYELELFSSLKRYPALLEAVKRQRQANEARWLARVISDLSPGRQPPLWDKLETLPMPVLLVAGALDSKYSQLATQIAEKIPDAIVKLVPEAGHNIHLEQPQWFSRELRLFLSKL